MRAGAQGTRSAPLRLREWQEHPELFRPPPAVIPHIAYEGRVTVIAGREKSGKSTLMGQAVACKSMGLPFIGLNLTSGAALYYGIDEPMGDLLRRLEGHLAHGDDTWVSDARPTADELAHDVVTSGAKLAVIDTLTECWWGFVRDENSADQVTSFLTPFVRVARDTGVALVFLHHTSKAKSEYAGSRALGAKVDIIGTMSAPSLKREEGERLSDADDDGRRLLAMKGRGVSHLFALSFDGTKYDVGDAPLPLNVRVMRALAAEPMASEGLSSALEKRKQDVLDVLRDLKASGYVVEEKRRNKLTMAGEAELARLMAPPVPAPSSGTAPERDGNRAGTGVRVLSLSGSGSVLGEGIREPEDEYERDERAAMRESA